MNRPPRRGARVPAFSLMEILIAVMILALGLLGLGAVFPAVVRAQRESVDSTMGVLAARSAEELLKSIDSRRMQAYGGEVERTARAFWFKELEIFPLFDQNGNALAAPFQNGNPKESPAWSACRGVDDFEIPIAFSAWKAMSTLIQADVKGQSTPMPVCYENNPPFNPQFQELDGPDGRITGDERDVNGAPLLRPEYQNGEWFPVPIDPADPLGSTLVIGDPSDEEADRLTFKLPLSVRLFPSGEGQAPQFVWDFAVQRAPMGLPLNNAATVYLPWRDRYPSEAVLVDSDNSLRPGPGFVGNFEPRLSVTSATEGEPGGDDHVVDTTPLQEPIRAAIFVRRIDPRIRVTDDDITLLEALTDPATPAASRRVPVGEDNDGVPTLDGTDGNGGVRYSRPRTSPVQFRYDPVSAQPLERRRDILFFAQDGNLSGAENERNYEYMSLPGQKLVDNRGNVYTVVGSGGEEPDRYVVVSPAVPASVTAQSAAGGVLSQVCFTAQVPVAVIVTEVAR